MYEIIYLPIAKQDITDIILEVDSAIQNLKSNEQLSEERRQRISEL
ncbi:MAG: hypothetical protein H5T98_09895 [Syntrophomonadaceae bacterium]|nr:hypothetical protein [Syntrophomonadaceae bacterium]